MQSESGWQHQQCWVLLAPGSLSWKTLEVPCTSLELLGLGPLTISSEAGLPPDLDHCAAQMKMTLLLNHLMWRDWSGPPMAVLLNKVESDAASATAAAQPSHVQGL
eukprot:1159140-Pelagomonas_calceolata.AAC.8